MFKFSRHKFYHRLVLGGKLVLLLFYLFIVLPGSDQAGSDLVLRPGSDLVLLSSKEMRFKLAKCQEAARQLKKDRDRDRERSCSARAQPLDHLTWSSLHAHYRVTYAVTYAIAY